MWGPFKRRDVAFVYHTDYGRTLAPVPLDPARADEILAFLLGARLLGRRAVSTPRPASLENLLRVHTPAYLESLQRPDALAQIFGAPVREDEAQTVIERQRLIVGGTIHATRLALARRRVAVSLHGGLHHAAPERGMGFCVFNDIAVAVRRLRARGFTAPVLVVDLDLHDGNGTRAAFAADPTVHTFSIHHTTWDDAPAAAATVIALGPGVADDAYLDALRRALPPVVAAHRPGLVVYVAGADPATDDRLGDWRITPAGMIERDRFVTDTVRPRGALTPLVVVLGGGYGTSAWRYPARYCAWLLSGNSVEPPDDMTIVLDRFRPIAREFTGTATPLAGNDWGLSDEDLAVFAPGAARDTLVLGYFSRLGLELLLERLGFLKQLGARGFPHAVLQVDFGSGLGQTIRVYCDAAKSDVLMELRVNRTARVIPGMEVLFVEWLLLQNPRRAFAGEVTALPGQQHPGLGLLRDVAGLLVVACETIGLDGVAAVPAHYYMAAIVGAHLRFVDPERQARFDALRAALQHVPLARASRALEEGRVLDAATGVPERWEPAPMALPVSARLRALFDGPPYDEAYRRARAQYSFRVT